jgi:hypothetical protein
VVEREAAVEMDDQTSRVLRYRTMSRVGFFGVDATAVVSDRWLATVTNTDLCRFRS